jgi:hypothetical protein
MVTSGSVTSCVNRSAICTTSKQDSSTHFWKPACERCQQASAKYQNIHGRKPLLEQHLKAQLCLHTYL